MFHKLEGWSWGLSVYVCIVVLTTVGFGDVAPVTVGGKIFTILYIFMSFTIVLSCVALVFAAIGTQTERGQAQVLKALRAGGKKDRTDREPALDQTRSPSQRRLRRLGSMNSQSREIDRHKRSEARRKYLQDLAEVTLSLTLVICVFAFVVHYNEGWGLLDSFYWSVVTVSTVGFGDMTPDKPSTRAVVAWLLIFFVAVWARSVGKMVSVVLDWISEYRMSEIMQGGVTDALMIELDNTAGADGKIERFEFAAYMLARLGRTPAADIDRIMEMFDDLDRENSGSLNRNDIRAHQSKKLGSRLASQSADWTGVDWTGPHPHDPRLI
jgi:potassium channel subfamily K